MYIGIFASLLYEPHLWMSSTRDDNCFEWDNLGEQAMGPAVCHWHWDTLSRIKWCASGWWRYQLNIKGKAQQESFFHQTDQMGWPPTTAPPRSQGLEDPPDLYNFWSVCKILTQYYWVHDKNIHLVVYCVTCKVWDIRTPASSCHVTPHPPTDYTPGSSWTPSSARQTQPLPCPSCITPLCKLFTHHAEKINLKVGRF